MRHRHPVDARSVMNGQLVVRKALDADTGDEAVADPRRVAGPEFLAADHGIEIHRTGRDVQPGELRR